MNHGDIGTNPNFELPQPKTEEELNGAQQQPEKAPAAVERGGANQHVQSAPPIVPAQDPAALAQAASSVSVGAAPAPPASQAATIAEDTDLIEKEWVERAKNIVQKTKDDPYLQNREISKVKAEYIEQRWHKKIKLVDDTK